MTKTNAFKNFSMLSRALEATNAMVSAVEATTPPSRGALAAFIETARQVLAIVAEADGHPDAEAEMVRRVVSELESSDDASTLHAQFQRVGEEGSRLAQALADRVERGREALGALKAQLAATSVPSEADAKKLGRYQALLQRSMSQQLEILQRVQEHVRQARRAATKKGSSFGTGSRSEVPVLLRVVK